MRTSHRGAVMLAIIAVVLAILFVRLGVWQLSRLGERKAENEARRAALAEPVLDLAALPAASDSAERDSLLWRRVRVRGTYDFEHEIVVRGRARMGSPGVHVLTPLRFPGEGAVLVLRGWLPAADALSASLASARQEEADAAGLSEVAGILELGAGLSSLPPRWVRFDGEEHLVLGSASLEQARRAIPYPLADVVLRRAPDTPPTPGAGAVGGARPRPERSSPGSTPVPLQPPTLDNGPHLAYAIQWFGFALVSLVGAALYIRSRGRRPQLVSNRENTT